MTINRREFLLWSAATTWLIGFVPQVHSKNNTERQNSIKHPLFAWQNDRLRLLIGRSEMGQGVMTGLAMLVAQQLDLSIDALDVDHERYDPSWSKQGTSASISIYTEYRRYREAAASLRAWLLDEAARRWQIDSTELSTLNGYVVSKSAQRLSFSELMRDNVEPITLKAATPRRFPTDSRDEPKRVDGVAKTNGSAIYGADIRLPNMRFAAWWEPPAGEVVESIDDRDALAIAGVERALKFDDGVAVVATGTFSARKGVAALKVKTRVTSSLPRDDRSIEKALSNAMSGRLSVLKQEGKSKLRSKNELRAEYRVPFLAHAPMEPVVATAHVEKSQVRLWLSTQSPRTAREAVANILKRPTSSA
jgi:isoquinoline 1-oxidoreductase subunit beta